MSLLSPPQIPLFRITLFYGPEAVEGDSDSVHCVFNVKKRSWKGGVQVEIVLKNSQLIRIETALGYKKWLDEILEKVLPEERLDYQENGKDLLVQLICFHKLQAFIHQGIKQENVQVSGDMLMKETEEAVQKETQEIKRQVVIELDLVDDENDE